MILSKEMLMIGGRSSSHTRRSKKVLLIDSRSDSLEKIFSKNNYTIIKAKTEEQVINKAHKYRPNLLIGDFQLADINCERLCQAIKADILLENVPIIVVTTKNNIAKVIKTVNGTVDDYIMRPFDGKELFARVERVIHRTEKAWNANPLTKLPGNIAIKREIDKKIENREKFATCFLDLDNFKAFNDYYGFARGDKAIEFTSQIIIKTVQKIKEKNISKDFFIGHIGGDDFVVISPIEEVDMLCTTIINSFDHYIKSLYDGVDLKKQYILSHDRSGNKKRFPLMTISIAVVSNEKRKISHSAQVSQIGTEIKSYIKQFPNSNYLKDRRR